MESFISPINGSIAKLISNIPIEHIELLYNEGLGISVKDYFKEIDKVDIFNCSDTGYEFYYPDTVSGDGFFYKQLEAISWYYQKWKWEFQATSNLIGNDNKVLEVGCGRGYFLEHLQKKDCRVLGLELNTEAISFASENGVKVLDEKIEVFAQDERNQNFDTVVAFQLLEHLSDINGFFKSCISLLKPGGRLIVAVPNNQAFFFANTRILPIANPRYINQLQTIALNMPPHHMGLWTKQSLINAGNYFDLKMVEVLEEPIGKGRKELNKEILANCYSRFERVKLRLSKKKFQLGDSLLAVYEKK